MSSPVKSNSPQSWDHIPPPVIPQAHPPQRRVTASQSNPAQLAVHQAPSVGRTTDESDVLSVFCEDEITDLRGQDSVFGKDQIPQTRERPEIEIISVTKARDR